MGADVGTVGLYGKDADGNNRTPGGTPASKVGGFFDNEGEKLDQATGENAPPEHAVEDYNNGTVPIDYGNTSPTGMLFGL